jgi:epoxyqueuosine reductase
VTDARDPAAPERKPAAAGPAAADIAPFVEDFVRDFLAVPENNNLGPGTSERAWQDFVVGFSRGDDQLYDFWKTHIGPFHWGPAEAFALGMSPEGLARGAAASAPQGGNTPGPDPPGAADLTVISWALSHTEATKADNRRQTQLPSERWVRSRIYGQSNNRGLHRALVAALAQKGHSAVAPALLAEHGERQSEGQGRSSNWSERHVAYTSGLGTFGLSGGLITSLGQAVRLGSVIVQARMAPTERPYSGPFDYCLYFAGSDCTACADRCPVGSMDGKARDKTVCAQHLEVTTAEFVQREFGFKGYGCGFCQTGVPCESGIPEG